MQEQCPVGKRIPMVVGITVGIDCDLGAVALRDDGRQRILIFLYDFN